MKEEGRGRKKEREEGEGEEGRRRKERREKERDKKEEGRKEERRREREGIVGLVSFSNFITTMITYII